MKHAPPGGPNDGEVGWKAGGDARGDGGGRRHLTGWWAALDEEVGGAQRGGRRAGTRQGAGSGRSELLLAYGCRIWAPPRPRPPDPGGRQRDAVLDDGGERGRGCTEVERERRGGTCRYVAGAWRGDVVVLGREEAGGAREAASARQVENRSRPLGCLSFLLEYGSFGSATRSLCTTYTCEISLGLGHVCWR